MTIAKSREIYRLIVKIFVKNIKMLVFRTNILMFSQEKNDKITDFLACFSKKVGSFGLFFVKKSALLVDIKGNSFFFTEDKKISHTKKCIF